MKTFIQVLFSNGYEWNAIYHTPCETLNFAENYSKHWNLKYSFKTKVLKYPK